MAQYWGVFDSPIGAITIEADDRAVTAIRFESESGSPTGAPRVNAVIRQTKQQLSEYFRGKRQKFELPLEPAGSDFQLRVWKALQSIQFGEAVSYGAVARKIRKPAAARAVGAACGRNPIPIVIPCHRVVGAGGKLTGYGGGIEIKEWLLKHEGADLA